MFELFPVHADSGIGDGEPVVLVIEINADFKGQMTIEDFFLGEALVAELFQGVGRVRD
jgi:hypothetical protein